MSQLTRKELEELNGGSFANDSYFNGFIAALGGLYVPGKSISEAGAHFDAFINMIAEIGDRLTAVMPVFVYKDGADSDAQFSVSAGTIMVRGKQVTFAGAIAQGALTTGTNHIWLNVSTAAAVTVSFGSSWPATEHIRLATIVQPGSGSWKSANITRLVGAQAFAPVRGVPYSIRRDFVFDTAASIDFGAVPAGAIVIPKLVSVTTVFDGSAPTIKVGDSGDDDRLIVTGDADLTSTGITAINRPHHYTSETVITGTYAADSSTAGAASVVLEVIP